MLQRLRILCDWSHLILISKTRNNKQAIDEADKLIADAESINSKMGIPYFSQMLLRLRAMSLKHRDDQSLSTHKQQVLQLTYQAFEILQQLFEPTHAQIAHVKNDLAGLPCEKCPNPNFNTVPVCSECWRSRFELYNEALEIRKVSLGNQHVLVATTLFHRAKHIVFHLHHIRPESERLKLLEEAVNTLEQAVAIRKVTLYPTLAN